MKKLIVVLVLALGGCMVEGKVDDLFPHPSTPGGCIGIPGEDIPVLFRPCESYSQGETCLARFLDGVVEVLPEQQMYCRTCVGPYVDWASAELICEQYEVLQ